MIITVASGKGGTGKTTVSTSLTYAISRRYEVAHVDLDVEEPDSNIFLKVPIEREEMIWLPLPEINYDKCTFCGVCQKVCEYNAIFVFKNTTYYPKQFVEIRTIRSALHLEKQHK